MGNNESFEAWFTASAERIRTTRLTVACCKKAIKDLKKARSKAIEQGKPTIAITNDIQLARLDLAYAKKRIRILTISMIKSVIKM